MAQKSINAGAVTDSSTERLHEFGRLRFETDGGVEKVYQYVQVVDAAVADGDALEVANATNPYIVSNDRSGGSSIAGVPAGVAVGTIAANSYGWILVRGYKANAKTDGSVAAGQAVIRASADGVLDSADSISAGKTFGTALANDTTSRGKVFVSTL